MTIYPQFFLLVILPIITCKDQSSASVNSIIFNKRFTNQHLLTHNEPKQRKMGVSINLFRLPQAEKLEDIKNLEIEIAKTTDTKVDLYKIASDLAIIFLNTTDPYSNTNSIPYKMLYGRQVNQSVSVGEIGGFIKSSEIIEITKWVKSKKIETFDGFSKMYDNLSPEVKKELEEMGTDNKNSLFNGYVRPLVVLYFTALENGNSVAFIGQ